MSGRSYPIWIDVTACTYSSSKSYGAKDTNEQVILVGSSKSNSHTLCTIINYKRAYDGYAGFKDVIIFRTKIDGIVVKEMIFKNNKGRAGEKLAVMSYLTSDPSDIDCPKCGCTEFLCGHNKRG